MNAKMLMGKINNIFLFSLLCLTNHSFAQSDVNFRFSFSSNRDTIYDYSYSEPFLIRQITNRTDYHKNIQSYYTDYVILRNGDTIYGKRYRAVFNRYEIRFRSNEGKIKLLHKDVKEIYSKNKISWVYLSPCDNRWEEYTVYLKGKVSYMWNGDKNAYCSDMLIISNEIYPIVKSHFSDKVWNILIKCPVFEEKYNAFYKEHKDKKLFWRTRKKC